MVGSMNKVLDSEVQGVAHHLVDRECTSLSALREPFQECVRLLLLPTVVPNCLRTTFIERVLPWFPVGVTASPTSPWHVLDANG